MTFLLEHPVLQCTPSGYFRIEEGENLVKHKCSVRLGSIRELYAPLTFCDDAIQLDDVGMLKLSDRPCLLEKVDLIQGSC